MQRHIQLAMGIMPDEWCQNRTCEGICLSDVRTEHVSIIGCCQSIQCPILVTVENCTECLLVEEIDTFLLPISTKAQTALAGHCIFHLNLYVCQEDSNVLVNLPQKRHFAKQDWSFLCQCLLLQLGIRLRHRISIAGARLDRQSLHWLCRQRSCNHLLQAIPIACKVSPLLVVYLKCCISSWIRISSSHCISELSDGTCQSRLVEAPIQAKLLSATGQVATCTSRPFRW